MIVFLLLFIAIFGNLAFAQVPRVSTDPNDFDIVPLTSTDGGNYTLGPAM